MNKNKKSIGIVCSDIYMRFPEIMEEEFDDLLEFLEDEHIRCEGATDVFMDLQKENKQLQQQVKKQKEVINKAMKFIKSSRCKYDGWEITTQLYEDEIKQLLDILNEVSE